MDKESLIIGRAADNALVPLLVDANGAPLVGLLGYYNSAWHKAPIPWGASDAYEQYFFNGSLPAGNSSQNLTATPADALTVITNLSAAYTGTVTNVQLRFDKIVGAITYSFKHFLSLASGVFVTWDGFLVVRPTDTLSVRVIAGTLNDDLTIVAQGYSVVNTL